MCELDFYRFLKFSLNKSYIIVKKFTLNGNRNSKIHPPLPKMFLSYLKLGQDYNIKVYG